MTTTADDVVNCLTSHYLDIISAFSLFSWRSLNRRHTSHPILGLNFNELSTSRDEISIIR